jgi:hypothetical protein
MPHTLVILQNAWSRRWAGRAWPRADWLAALHDSRTGRRLARIWPAPARGVWFDNTTPAVAPAASVCLPPDLDHLRGVIRRTRPRLVVACGAQAARAVQPLWDGQLICMPHPCYRCLSNAHLDTIRRRVHAAPQRISCRTTDVTTVVWSDLQARTPGTAHGDI